MTTEEKKYFSVSVDSVFDALIGMFRFFGWFWEVIIFSNVWFTEEFEIIYTYDYTEL